MSFRLVDTHQHLWDPSRFSYSWMQDLPAIRHRSLVEEYRIATRGASILGSVYIDTDVDDCDRPDEAQLIFELADQPANDLLGIVASVRPERPGFLDHLRPFFGHPKLKGVRRVLHTQDDLLSESEIFVSQIRDLARFGLSFDLCVLARQLPRALRLVRACPEVRFILDHCGNPEIRQRVMEPWKSSLAALAREPNVDCKLSGLVNCAAPGEVSADVLRPFVHHVIECFGWNRVVWGSDWPVCTLVCPPERWIELTDQLLIHATADQRERVLGLNAIRVYRLPEGIIDQSK